MSESFFTYIAIIASIGIEIGFVIMFIRSIESQSRGYRALSFALFFGFSLFLIGFIGPMILDPRSAQGPLLGIFITGPLGFIIGLLAGLFLPISKK